MAEEFGGGSFREVKVGYAVVRHGEAQIPKEAKVIGYHKETFKGSIIEYVVYIQEET